MSVEVAAAVKNLKTIGTEITQWENRAEVVKVEVEKLNRTRDALQAEIDKKSSDFNIYMAQKDAEIKKSRADMMAEREQLVKDKEEFQSILKAHKQTRAALEAEKQAFGIEQLKHASTTKNVQEFILAVRRATGLLGI